LGGAVSSVVDLGHATLNTRSARPDRAHGEEAGGVWAEPDPDPGSDPITVGRSLSLAALPFCLTKTPVLIGYLRKLCDYLTRVNSDYISQIRLDLRRGTTPRRQGGAKPWRSFDSARIPRPWIPRET
jgi:hypothetical protein